MLFTVLLILLYFSQRKYVSEKHKDREKKQKHSRVSGISEEAQRRIHAKKHHASRDHETTIWIATGRLSTQWVKTLISCLINKNKYTQSKCVCIQPFESRAIKKKYPLPYYSATSPDYSKNLTGSVILKRSFSSDSAFHGSYDAKTQK